MNRRSFLAATLAAPWAAPAIGQVRTRLKFILNWRYQGPQGLFFLAEDRGFWREEGLEVAMDQGEGSAAAVTKVATGAYDVGFGDINATVALAATRPAEAPLGVMMLYNRPPFCIAVRADGPIRTPKDLEGRTLGGPANDGALRLFPAFARLAGIDASKVTIVTMQPQLREQMLNRGQVDGVFGFINTIRFSARLIGTDADQAYRFIAYGDYGMDLYSNCIVVSRSLARDTPQAVRGLLRGINRGLAAMLAEPDAAVAAVARREPPINVAVERARLDATVRDEMNHPEIARIGLGDVVDERFERGIDIIVQAQALPRRPAMGEVFVRDFLPPLAERITRVMG
ncbi:ABC transporter substrate-binding protein [Elioraea thermophila]|uniref:ABC transporter substrate-binding protein n=1 Tax=Elioraea thermophila TaxID=2185104 RepID=UPI000DF26B87|nr:ABC transporter substrate-binding protein [Elioraea thermophila]